MKALSTTFIAVVAAVAALGSVHGQDLAKCDLKIFRFFLLDKDAQACSKDAPFDFKKFPQPTAADVKRFCELPACKTALSSWLGTTYDECLVPLGAGNLRLVRDLVTPLKTGSCFAWGPTPTPTPTPTSTPTPSTPTPSSPTPSVTPRPSC